MAMLGWMCASTGSPQTRSWNYRGLNTLSEKTDRGNCFTKETNMEDEKGLWLRPESMEVWGLNSHCLYVPPKTKTKDECAVGQSIPVLKERPLQNFSEGIVFTPILLWFPQRKSWEKDRYKSRLTSRGEATQRTVRSNSPSEIYLLRIFWICNCNKF